MNFLLALSVPRAERIAVYLSLAVLAIALLALAGWLGDAVALRAPVAGSLSLQPATAIVLIVAAAGLVAAALGRVRLSQAAGGLLLASCAVWLTAYIAGVSLASDLALFHAQVLAQTPAPMQPGRPSIITCVGIALYAAALLGVRSHARRIRAAVVTCALLGFLIAALSMLPFALQDPLKLTVLSQGLRLAFNTTVAIGALCAGILVLMHDNGWVRLVTGSGEQARIARLLMPVVLTPIGVGAIANAGVRLGYYGPDVRVLLIIELCVVALLLVVLAASWMLGKERRKRDTMATALEHSSVIVCAPEGTILLWPRACEALYGWSAKEAIGRSAGDLFSVHSPEQREVIQAALLRDGEWRGDVQQRTKAGDIRWVANHWVAQVGGPDSEPVMVGTLNDITDVKVAEASLRESQERLMLAVSAYHLGIGDADIVNRTIVVDAGFERLLGLPPGGVDGDLAKLNAMVVSQNPDRDLDIAARKPQQFDEVRMRRADGEVRDFHGIRRFFYSEEGVHVRTIGVYRDVTEERRAQAELALRGDHLSQLRAELAHVSRLSAMGEMAAALAHELNQPLTAIGNTVGALKIMLGDGSKKLDELTRVRVVRAASQAEGQAVRAGEIVRRLRDFVARGEADARVEQLDQLIGDAVALGAPNAAADGTSLQFNLSQKAHLVMVDRIQIQQVLVNLIRNAGEAMRGAVPPHLLTISTVVRGGMVEIGVRDSGPGVAPDMAAALFSPFLSSKADGMGVGLSICRRLIEAHGGRMWLEQSSGGADFRFTIPLAPKALRQPG